MYVRRAGRSSFFIFIQLHACRLSGNPSFLHVFRFSRRRLESVCVCVCVCVCPAGARSNHISGRSTVHGVATGPPRPFSIVTYFSRLARGGLRSSDFRLTFALFFSIFRLSLYTHVRTSSFWSRRCVCSIVSQGAPAGRCTLGNPRATFEFQFCE